MAGKFRPSDTGIGFPSKGPRDMKDADDDDSAGMPVPQRPCDPHIQPWDTPPRSGDCDEDNGAKAPGYKVKPLSDLRRGSRN